MRVLIGATTAAANLALSTFHRTQFSCANHGRNLTRTVSTSHFKFQTFCKRSVTSSEERVRSQEKQGTSSLEGESVVTCKKYLSEGN